MTARTCQDSVLGVTQYPTPYQYRVRVARLDSSSTPGFPISNPTDEGRSYQISAWTAEDAYVQTAVLLGIRGAARPAWSIMSIEPYEPKPGEQIFGGRIYRAPAGVDLGGNAVE